MPFIPRDRHGSFASVSIELRKVFVPLLPGKTCVGRAAGGTLEQKAGLFSQYSASIFRTSITSIRKYCYTRARGYCFKATAQLSVIYGSGRTVIRQ